MIDRNCTALLYLLAFIGGSSMLYFLCLVAGIPFWLFLILNLTIVIAAIRAFVRTPNDESIAGYKKWVGIVACIAGIFLITNRTFYQAVVDGGWDAWAMWNYHARIMTSQEHWQNVVISYHYDHPDYPLCLPGSIAWMSRLLGTSNLDLVAFGMSFWMTLCIPLLIFFKLFRRNVWLAALVLIYFATNDFYLINSTAQCADILVAAFLLAAMVAIGAAKESKSMAGLAVFFAGCAAWTKNEGILIAALFVLFYSPVLFRRSNINATLAGAALPLIVVCLFKGVYSPDNDLVQGLHDLAARLKDPQRYATVWQFLKDDVLENYLPAGCLLAIYGAVCIWLRQLPARGLMLILTILAAYFTIYILTPYDLAWHLGTSLNRLLLQLVPAAVFVVANELAKLSLGQFRLSKASA